MNDYLKQLIRASTFDEIANVHKCQHPGSGNYQLGFSHNATDSFLIENPTQEDLEQCAQALMANDYNYLFIESKNGLHIFCQRADKAQYNIYYLTENVAYGAVVTNFKSIVIIANRFLEDSLFDNRENEKRYLKKENWFKYTQPINTFDFDSKMQQLGTWQPRLRWLLIYLEEAFNIKNYSFRQSCLIDIEEAHEQPVAPLEEHLEITKFISRIYPNVPLLYLENGVLLPYPTGREADKQLENLPHPYWLTDKLVWKFMNPNSDLPSKSHNLHLQIKIEEEIFEIKTEILDLDYYTTFVELKNFNSKHLKQAIEIFFKNKDTEGILAISRPMRHGDKKHKSLFIHRTENEDQTTTTTGMPDTVNTSEELITYIKNWFD